ncbi:enoyl-CoA hydratase/carnithine racemase [Rhodofomes roseus]|uniref:Enoyl-CoA hydratase/carnithine racemase n=1 Tax=Rhodofomes roseus TaxID=34475 RepID=A0ABQ8KHJ3_9APHY|nr:enoyl-CoA hydratase/carnithine racemase [Rhodofomes roseus]KAH9837336.1 enoyl-CoA hydratase/carnithine racemase [Rhodofomes roseus]
MGALQPPEHSDEIKVSFPQDHVMLLTLNRPKALNAVSPTMKEAIERVLDWFDNETSLWVVIINGEGRIFCAGADLIAWNKRQGSQDADDGTEVIADKHGFAGISRRSTSGKPIIAAVHGGAYGGGTELVLNCDLVVASDDAVFALPEVKRGVVAIAGGMPRLARIAGHQLASEMLLLGKPIKASEAAGRFGFVNKVVPKSELLPSALAWAAEIVTNSPDSVQSTKRALLLTNQHAHVEDVVTAHVRSKESKRHFAGDNIKEGLRAFSERRKPAWTSPAKL